jgi:hypothetical protein
MFLIARRLVTRKVTRLVNVVIGLSLSLPALAAFVAITNLLQPRRGKTVIQDFAVILHRPSQALPVVAVLAIGGLAFGLTMPTSRTTLTNPTNLTHPTN